MEEKITEYQSRFNEEVFPWITQFLIHLFFLYMQ